MAALPRPQWQRIYRQSVTLAYKNLLIFYKAPISTICRALLFPIIVTLVFCELKHLDSISASSTDQNNGYGIAASSTPIKDLAAAITSTSQQRLVFVSNGMDNASFHSLVESIGEQQGMPDVDLFSTDDPNDLFDICKQSLAGRSNCFAAVIFQAYNETNVEYTIAMDQSITDNFGFGDYRTQDSYLAQRILPLQWNVTEGFQVQRVIQKMDGYLYVVFFMVQILFYVGGAYVVERYMWGVTRNYESIDASSDVALRCTNLSKTYYGKRPWYWPFMRKGDPKLAIDKLDLEVKKGSVTFLLGPNGGGKTTTLKCVAGMTAMDKGSKLELNEDGVIFGICPQSNVFWDNLTVQEHVKIWRQLKTAAFDGTVTSDDDDVVAECDLEEKLNAPAKTLSGGQMRKLQLAISFVGGSKICCIDEASSGLDPLSRRNIWNIIQKGHNRRTILVTTHFLDEADVLADHIAIVYQGKLVCEGPSTSLKSEFGDDYIIRDEPDSLGDNMIWRTTNSAEATRKVLELEALTEDSKYDVVFPTLEQVFLKVTSESHTAVHDQGGDGIVGEEQADTVIYEKIFALEGENARDIDLDVGHSIGLARQVWTLYRKRYSLLLQKSGWISYTINLIIPVIIASALVKFMYRMDSLQTCATNELLLRNATARDQLDPYSSHLQPFAPLDIYYPPTIYVYGNEPSGFVGPASVWTGADADALYVDSLASFFTEYPTTNVTPTWQAQQALSTRVIVNDTATILQDITNLGGSFYNGFGLFTPVNEAATLFFSTEQDLSVAGIGAIVFNLITNGIANTTTPGTAKTATTHLRGMRHADSNVSGLALPISMLIGLSFIVAASIAITYPSFERNNRVRALHYCNGVSPFALWLGYLLFDMQFIIVQAVFVWELIFAGPLSRLWYASSYLLGVFILFGIATYLGTYLLSLYTKTAAFAIAAGLHVLLAVLYLVAYIINQAAGDQDNLFQTYSNIQYGLGLSSPGANLLRAFFVTSNSFSVLCGKYGDSNVSQPFAYVRYGSVYANLLIQIIFLIIVLAIQEYGSADWIRRNITHRGAPSRLHYIVDSGSSPGPTAGAEAEKTANTTTPITPSAPPNPTNILDIFSISKYFGKTFAVENISLSIASNQILALLGSNGAGKTTVINMIRGELKPNFGSIYIDGISVLSHPQKARMHMGVCPQDDAIDNLTVLQTLSFYATVKGLSNVSSNVEKVMQALNITSFSKVSVKDLSGGTRRKLSVAIALLGNPKILLLDEPSTGQDAGAKRILWKALHAVSKDRAILLTTHSMEEAEALATDVAIMGTRMLAKGSLGSLQERYGGVFGVRAVRARGVERETVFEAVKMAFGDRVRNYEDRNGQVSFGLPHDKSQLGAIMRAMERLKGDPIHEEEEEEGSPAAGSSAVNCGPGAGRVIQDYTITGPTLEEVFMNVARESGVAGGV